MKLIDKDAVLAEIEKRIVEYKDMKIDSSYYEGMVASLEFFRDEFINTIEVKEVDLEKEIKEYINDEWCDEWSGDVGNWIRCRRGTTPMEVEDVKDIAKHFFELGLSASNPLTWKDMRELHIIFESLDVDIELSRSKLQKETLGYYEEVLKRFKEKKEE